MKNKNKMWICLIILVLFGGLYQAFMGNKVAWIIGGIMLFSVGFGWYGCKAKEDDLKWNQIGIIVIKYV